MIHVNVCSEKEKGKENKMRKGEKGTGHGTTQAH
jgi:hypothetical protein